MASIILNGITWGHSRGITPLLAISQRYSELHPEVEIRWQKRSLQAFADYPIEKLTEAYDLLIIDHPWVGCAAATHCVLPLNEYLPAAYLQDQASNSVGASYESYVYNGSLWALPIDAATPAACYRKDLLPEPPQTWDELLQLAKAGKVAVPGIPIDTLMHFYSFCIAFGATPFANDYEVIDTATGTHAIECMKQLYSLVDRRMFDCNPIAVAELMSSTSDFWYCPFAYAYSNYSRTGFAKYLLHYSDVVSVNGNKLQTTIGGTGLSVSAFSRHKSVAVDVAKMMVDGDIQRTMYVEHGGQPGHRRAWTDAAANQLTNGFFDAVLPVMDNGYMRPRYNGYLHFQDHAGTPLRTCLMEDGDPAKALQMMNNLYRQSIHTSTPTITT